VEALGFRQLAPKLNQHFNRVLDTPLPLHCRRYSEDLDLGRLACCRGLGIPARQRDSKMDGNGVRWFEPTGLQRAHCRGMPACSVWVQGPECVIWCSVPLHMGLPVQRTDLQSFEAALRLHASWKPSPIRYGQKIWNRFTTPPQSTVTHSTSESGTPRLTPHWQTPSQEGHGSGLKSRLARQTRAGSASGFGMGFTLLLARSFTLSPSSRHPPFTQYPFPSRSLVGGAT
jgi:hypothetical protein